MFKLNTYLSIIAKHNFGTLPLMSLSTSIYPSLYFVWETCNFELILFLHNFMTLRYLRFSQNRADKNFGNKPSHSITDRRFTSFLRDWRKEQIGRRSGRPLGTVYVKPFPNPKLEYIPTYAIHHKHVSESTC